MLYGQDEHEYHDGEVSYESLWSTASQGIWDQHDQNPDDDKSIFEETIFLGKLIIGLEFQTVEKDLDVNWGQDQDSKSNKDQSDPDVEENFLLSLELVSFLHQIDH